MTLESEENTVIVKTRTVYCEGSDDNMSDGHPKVWLKILLDLRIVFNPTRKFCIR